MSILKNRFIEIFTKWKPMHSSEQRSKERLLTKFDEKKCQRKDLNKSGKLRHKAALQPNQQVAGSAIT